MLVPMLALLTTITVDDDGPASFTNIADAIAAAQPGDVLLVEPGTYASFTLGKSLTILGHPGAHVVGLSVVDHVENVTLAGLRFDRLGVHDVSGRAVLDELELGGVSYTPSTFSLFIESCAEVVATRLDCKPAFTNGFAKPVSLRVRGSTLALADSTIVGAEGQDCFSITCNGGHGASALHATLSTLHVAGTHLEGGAGGIDGAATFGEILDGIGGSGAWLQSCSASLQGCTLIGGHAPGCFNPCIGYALNTVDASLVVGNLELFGPVLTSASTSIEPTPFEPWIEIAGVTGPAQPRQLSLYAPHGEPCVVVASAASALAPWPLGGAQPPLLWLDPSAIVDTFTLVGQGAVTPASHTWLQPPTSALAGLTLTVQAAGIELASSKFPLTNPALIVLGF